MTIAITGASGFIGRRLMKALSGANHKLRVLSRHAGTNLPPGVQLYVWDAVKGQPPAESLDGVDAVVHLAGEPIAQRWSDEVKQRIRETRATGTRHLVQALSTVAHRPAVLVSGCAIGYYGSRGDEILTEASGPGSGFMADVCVAWEKEADLAESLGIRLVKLRTGMVLGTNGGALAKMLPPFKAGMGGKMGHGDQWMSWVHLDDVTGLIQHAIDNPLRGPVNGTAPHPVTNADFTKALGHALGRPAVVPMPAFTLKFMFGEMSDIMLASQRVLPKAAEEAGYTFRYPQLEGALENIVASA
ncbi:MAG TPA: TIGR01777 family oxidoreductase [Bryobacteraceae bacterium]|nr:TIGR01777 family oxidoreductase [Bryobacteraceae bacterium]